MKGNMKQSKPSLTFLMLFLRTGLLPLIAGAQNFALSDPLFSSYYPEMKYEQCDCVNNKFTKHITAPYKKEIESWFIKTASPEDQATQAGTACVDCVGEEDPLSSKEDKSFWETIKDWFNSITGRGKDEKPKVSLPRLPLEKQKPDFIPSICFQISMELQSDNPKSQKDYFTCIHEHYDGSDSDKLCVVSEPGRPKKCLAIPVACEDAKDPTLTCAEKYKTREDNKTKTGCNRGSVYPRKPCINEEYTAMTAKAFHDVAECLNVPLDMAFSVLHHESRFILNNESSTGALCHSQVTGPAVADFNSFVEGKDYYPEIPDLLPKNIKNKCPSTWKHFEKVKTKYSKKNDRFEVATDQDKCRLNLNPYTCLFYGLSYLKILTAIAEEALRTANKMEYAKVKGRTFIFKDQKERERTEKKLNKELEIRQISIFSDEDTVKKWLVVIGYNGGLSIPTSVFSGFMNQIKAYLSDPKNSRDRAKLLAKGLNATRFKTTFISYIRRNYPQGKRRKREVANYMAKIQRDMESLREARRARYGPLLPADICPR